MPKGSANKKLFDGDIDKIVRLYTTPDENGKWIGCKRIGKMFGVSSTAVQRALRTRLGKLRTPQDSAINRGPCKPIKNIPPTGQPAPSCKCGCGDRVIWNQRKNRWNVYVNGHYRKDALYKNQDWLRHEYLDKHRAMTDIANECGVGFSTIGKFLVKFHIPTRSHSDALVVNGKINGPKNPAWKGGVAKWPYSPSWKRIARLIRKRDNYTCQICHEQFQKSSKLLHVHHIDGNKYNNEPTNLVTVCASCHPKGKQKR